MFILTTARGRDEYSRAGPARSRFASAVLSNQNIHLPKSDRADLEPRMWTEYNIWT